MIPEKRGCGVGKMPCESCGVQFSVFRRKRACSECERLYCAACLRRGGGMCAPCRALSTRPLARHAIAHLKVRDLQCFLHRQNVSTRGCVEKEELVTLCVQHVNSSAYRRRGSRSGNSPFTTLKGFTNNINDFINSAFDLRNPPQQGPHQPPSTTNSACFNSAHAHWPPPAAPRERFTTTPGGERDIHVPVPPPAASPVESTGARVDTADCFEIEDIDEAGWEFISSPAQPLPNDSELLMTETTTGTEATRVAANEGSTLSAVNEEPTQRAEPRLRAGAEGEGTPARAASALELRPEPAAPDTASLRDEPLMDDEPANDNPGTPNIVTLESFKSAEELESLNVKQLKELLARNRVEYRGCLERAELLERATRLWREHARYKDEVDNLPIEECCKICMAAPLECVLLECGHIAACTRCSTQLAECPICRQYVVRAVRFFRS